MHQGTFDFMDEPTGPRKRSDGLFFCLFPGVGASRRIGRVASRVIGERRLKGTRVRNDRLHLSLHVVGSWPRLRPQFVEASHWAGDAIVAEPVEVTLAAVETLPIAQKGGGTRKVLVLAAQGDGLFEVHGVLRDALRANGLRASDTFAPHVTLLYGDQDVPPEAIEPIRFVADEFVLVHSEHGLTRHNVLKRWSLNGRRAAED